jgi:two-component system, NtrC family, sensor kinase
VLGVISSSTGDLKPVFDVILANAVKICGAGFGNLSLYDGKDLRMAAMHNAPFAFQEQHRSDPVIPRNNSIGGSVIAKRQVIHVHDMAVEEPYCHSMLAKKAGARSALGVPMLRDDTLVGMISIYRQAVHPFSDKQIALVQNFAAQAVIAIENARLLNELRQRTDDLSKSLDDLRMAQASLVHAQKMAALGQLTAGIAHEIKNPLNFVNNFAGLSVELLDELKDTAARSVGAPDPGKRAEIAEIIGMLTGNLEKIVEHGRRADGIVRSMLQHSRGSSEDWQSTDLNALAQEALNLAYHGARAQDPNFDIALEHDLDRNLAPVDVVPQELTRVLLNLIGNGLYAVDKRSREGDGTFRPALKVTTREFGESVEVRVRDNGVGIPPENRDKLFQPFFTTKPTGEGTGLGLSISYEIVTQQHGGTFTVHSEVGDFTEFTVRLPRRRHGVS